MPLQTMFGSKVTLVETTQRHPLGTIRIEGDKTYKYMKAVGTIHSLDGCSMSATGAVVVTGSSLKTIGINTTFADLSSGDYFWMQVAGEITGTSVTNLVTNGGTVGYPAYCTDATGKLTGAAGSGTAVGTATVVVSSATVGTILLAGLL